MNFIQGEVIGHSVFEWMNEPAGATKRGLAFMRSVGIHFDIPEENAIDKALQEAETMPAYPNPACVKRLEDVIVVRISDTLYE